MVADVVLDIYMQLFIIKLAKFKSDCALLIC